MVHRHWRTVRRWGNGLPELGRAARWLWCAVWLYGAQAFAAEPTEPAVAVAPRSVTEKEHDAALTALFLRSPSLKSPDPTALLWPGQERLKDFQEAPRLQMQAVALESPAIISPDRRWVASESRGVVTLWAADSGVQLRSWRVSGEYSFPSLSFTPDSQSLAVFVAGTGLDLWNIATGQKSLDLARERRGVKGLLGRLLGRGLVVERNDERTRIQVQSLVDGSLSSVHGQDDAISNAFERRLVPSSRADRFGLAYRIDRLGEDPEGGTQAFALSVYAEGSGERRGYVELARVPSVRREAIALGANAAWVASIALPQGPIRDPRMSGHVVLRDIQTGRVRNISAFNNFQAYGVRFLRDGQWLAAWRESRIATEASPAQASRLRVVDLRTGAVVWDKPLEVLGADDGTGDLLLVRDAAASTTRLLQLPQFHTVSTFQSEYRPISRVEVLGERLLVADGQRIHRMALTQVPVEDPVTTHKEQIATDRFTARMAFVSDQRQQDGYPHATVSIQMADNRIEAVRLPDAQESSELFSFIPGGPLAIVGCKTRELVSINVQLKKELGTLFMSQGFDASLDRQLSAQGENSDAMLARLPCRLYFATDDGQVRKVADMNGLPKAIRFGRDGSLWAVERTAIVEYDRATYQPLRRHGIPPEAAVTIEPDLQRVAVQGRHLRSGSGAKVEKLVYTVDVYSLPDMRQLAQRVFATAPTALQFLSPDNVVFGEDAQLRRWDFSSAEPLVPQLPPDPVVSDDLRGFAVVSPDGRVLVQDLASGVQTLMPAECMKPSAFSPAGGRWLLCVARPSEQTPKTGGQWLVADVQKAAVAYTFNSHSRSRMPEFAQSGNLIFFKGDTPPALQRPGTRSWDRTDAILVHDLEQGVTRVLDDDLALFPAPILDELPIVTSADGHRVAIAYKGGPGSPQKGLFFIRVYEAHEPNEYRLRTQIFLDNASLRGAFAYPLTSWGMSLSGRHLALGISYDIAGSGSDAQTVQWIDLETVTIQREYSTRGHVWNLRFGRDDNTLLASDINGEVAVMDLAQARVVRHLEHNRRSVDDPAPTRLTRDAWLLRTPQGWERHDLAQPASMQTVYAHERRISGVSLLDAQRALVIDEAGVLSMVDLTQSQRVAQIYLLSDGQWVVSDAVGRFDTASLENLHGLNWFMPGGPMHPLPLEAFMRDYYEPRLLQRILAREDFTPVRPLQGLNLTQPTVRITSVTAPTGSPLAVIVGVEVSPEEAPGVPSTPRAAAYDLRLFRDGQLVGYADGLVATVDGGAVQRNFHVRLPTVTAATPLEFSAYAFNDDRVKSATARAAFRAPAGLPKPAPQAILLNIGVNVYETPQLNLDFAVNDARRINRALVERLKTTRLYRQVADQLVISDEKTPAAASKENIRRALGQLTRAQPHQFASGLPVAGPDDLVIISFSGHGYVSPTGRFYLVPHDIGRVTGTTVTPEFLARAISSDELSLWLRDVDARDIVFIVDACHSAASVQERGFKPGPMGSRGLGQLAFDKGMRILAATQPGDVALESESTQQGLLSYALIHDGMEVGHADYHPQDRRITLDEWLSYAVKRVPILTQEVLSANFARNGTPRLASRTNEARQDLQEGVKLQQPALFDFRRKRREPLLSTQ